MGVSRDTVEAQRRFSERQCLPFPMLCDPDGSMCRAYGAVGTLGGLFGVASRVSVLIAPDGTVARTYPRVSPSGHPAEVLQDVRKLRGG